MAQLVKNLPAMWETWVQSLGREDSLLQVKKVRRGRLPVDINKYVLFLDLKISIEVLLFFFSVSE